MYQINTDTVHIYRDYLNTYNGINKLHPDNINLQVTYKNTY